MRRIYSRHRLARRLLQLLLLLALLHHHPGLHPLQAASRPKLNWNLIPSTQSPNSNQENIRFTITDTESRFWQLEMATGQPTNFVPISGALHSLDAAREYPVNITSRARFFRLQSLQPAAATYARNRQLTDPESIRDISQWYEGLEFIDLATNVLWMASYRLGHQFPMLNNDAFLAPNLELGSFKGPAAQFQYPPVLDSESWITGGTNWALFPNPLDRPSASNFAIIAVFQSGRSNMECIVGSEGPKRGPVLMAGGSSTQGTVPTELFFDFTATGTNSAPEECLSGRRTYFGSNRGIWQFVATGFTPETIQLESMTEPVHASLKSVPQAWNNNDFWSIGARLDGLAPLKRRLAFVMILDRQLDPYEIGSVRKLYRKTLGRTLPFAPYNCVFEGDSFTAQAQQRNYVQQLTDSSPWSPLIYVSNNAKGGETARQMIGQFPIQVEPLAHEPGKNILFFWAGANDLLERDAETIYRDLKTYWAMARSAGFYVVGFTIIPNGGFSGARETDRLLLNEWIRESGQQKDFDVLVDVANLPELQDPMNGRYFLPDRVHLRTEAGTVIARLLMETVQFPPP